VAHSNSSQQRNRQGDTFIEGIHNALAITVDQIIGFRTKCSKISKNDLHMQNALVRGRQCEISHVRFIVPAQLNSIMNDMT
jgi:hypothetical protein